MKESSHSFPEFIDQVDMSSEKDIKRASLLHMQWLMHGIRELEKTQDNVEQIIFYVDHGGQTIKTVKRGQ